MGDSQRSGRGISSYRPPRHPADPPGPHGFLPLPVGVFRFTRSDPLRKHPSVHRGTRRQELHPHAFIPDSQPHEAREPAMNPQSRSSTTRSNPSPTSPPAAGGPGSSPTPPTTPPPLQTGPHLGGSRRV